MWMLLTSMAFGAELTPHLSFLVGDAAELDAETPLVVGTWSPRCDSCESTWKRLENIAERNPAVDVLAVTDDRTTWLLPHLRRLDPEFSVAVDATQRLSRNLRSGACGTGGWEELFVVVDGEVVWSGTRGLQRALARIRRGETLPTRPAGCLGLELPYRDNV